MRSMRRPAVIAAIVTSTAYAGALGASAAPPTTDNRPSIDLPTRVDRGPQPPDLTSTPPSAGDATAKADAVQAALDNLVRDGAVGVVARVDSPTLVKAWAAGERRVWTDLPVRTGSAFRVASNTKMMIATLAMQEIDRGRWTLRTTVGEIYPGLLPAPYDRVTVEQLLSHRSGMPDGLGVAIAQHMNANTYDEYFRAVGDAYSDGEIIDAALATPWLFPPGSGFSYSNAGYVVIGQLLAHQNGQPLGALLQGRIFNRAGMPGSAFPTRPGLRSGSLVGAARTPWRWYSMQTFNPTVFSAAGAAVATDADLNTFTRSLLRGQLVSKPLVAQMIRPRTSQLAYGLGIYRIGDPCRAGSYLYGHDGAAIGTLSFAFTSADGSRQFSMGLSGRYYPKNPNDPPPYDLNAALLAVARAGC